MLLRDDLTQFLRDLYGFENFQDKCENGLQVEGKDSIQSIIFGVSFNQPFLDQALEKNPDAIIVHHGIFQDGVFKLTGPLKQKVKRLLDQGISLYGIHLPMDAHPQMGHGALLLAALEAQKIEPFDLGAQGENTQKHTLDNILKIFHNQLHPVDFPISRNSEDSLFSLSNRYGFTVLQNGPAVPNRVAVITGSSSGWYEKAIEKGIDTFFAGDIKEKIPGISLDSHTNFINLGHYYSEKPGVLALEKLIAEKFAVHTNYIEIANPI